MLILNYQLKLTEKFSLEKAYIRNSNSNYYFFRRESCLFLKVFFRSSGKNTAPTNAPARVKLTTLKIPSTFIASPALRKAIVNRVIIMQTPATSAVRTAFFFLTLIAFAPAKTAARKFIAEHAYANERSDHKNMCAARANMGSITSAQTVHIKTADGINRISMAV